MAALSSTSSNSTLPLLISPPGSADAGISVEMTIPKRQYFINMAHLFNMKQLFKGISTENARVLIEIDRDRLITVDPIRQINIIALAEEALNANLTYTIGVIREISNGNVFNYIYDADGLEGVFQNSPRDPKNPINRNPIKVVHYYTLSGKTDSVFEHFRTSSVPRSPDCATFIQTFLSANDKYKTPLERAKTLHELCDFYIRGKGCEESLEKAEECLRKAGDFGDGGALKRLAEWYTEGEENYCEYDPKVAIDLYKRAADLGCIEAIHDLALWCEDPVEGDEVAFASEDRLKLAFQCYEKGAKLEDTVSLYHLGLCYKNNRGVDGPDNQVKAFNCFKKAAEAGHYDAYFELGLCYKNNYGVKASPENFKLAIDQFEKIIQSACMPSYKTKVLYEIGCCYEIGLNLCSLKALEYYQKAGENGHLEAQKKALELIFPATSSSSSTANSSSSSSEATVHENISRKRSNSPTTSIERPLKQQREESKESS